MKSKRTPMYIVLALVAIVAMVFGIKAYANSQKVPTGPLKFYEFHLGGGMNPFDEAIFHLRYDEKTHQPLLTLSGDCQGERITFEVTPDVFDRCAEIIKEHRLYRTKGYYKPRFEVLDAPSANFHFGFEGSDEWYSGSGDWPSDISKGVNAVNTYLHSLKGDRKAEGHVDRIYGGDDLPGRHWTDGYCNLTTTNTDASELKQYLRALSDKENPDDIRSGMGYERFHEGDQHYILIHDYNYNQHRLFYSFDGKPESIRKMAEEHIAALRASKPAAGERWTIVNERFLSQPMLDQLNQEQLKQMQGDIRQIPLGDYGSMTRMTDIGQVNFELLSAVISEK
ncbi:MAG: hypothetical protein IKW98_02170 [Prevotella sp.]|nr:hypothetical protein [Prevotella sp.]